MNKYGQLINALSLRELYEANNPKFNERAKNCKTFRIKYKSSGDRYLFFVKCRESYSDPRGHIVSIKFDFDRDETVQRQKNIRPYELDVKVRCGCESFAYWGQAFNITQLGANLDFIENRPPDVRDPNRDNFICKHIARVRQKTLKTLRMKQLEQKYKKSASFITDEDLIIEVLENSPEIEIDKTFIAVKSFLSKSFSKQEVNVLISNITPDNYEESLLNFGVII